jgi:hypothetical protein
MEFIDGILRADAQAPRKQRPVCRIWQRIHRERTEATALEFSVRRYVRQRREELGQAVRKTFVPQVHACGSEAQVDWYDAVAALSWGTADGSRDFRLGQMK